MSREDSFAKAFRVFMDEDNAVPTLRSILPTQTNIIGVPPTNADGFTPEETRRIIETFRNAEVNGATSDPRAEMWREPGNPRGNVQYDMLSVPSDNIAITPRYQLRAGSSHARGGRKRGVADIVRRNYGIRGRSLICRFLSDLSSEGAKGFASDFISLLATESLEEGIEEGPEGRGLWTASQLLAAEEDICKFVKEHKTKSNSEGLQILYGPVVGICARFSMSSNTFPSGGQGISSKARERHTCCTWIDKCGDIRCSCIGQTEFGIRAKAGTFTYSCCTHASFFVEFLSQLATRIGRVTPNTIRVCGKALNELTKVKFGGINIVEYTVGLPHFSNHHDENIVVLATKDQNDSEEVRHVPLRRLTRAGGRLICAFCDLAQTNSCGHVRQVHSLSVHGGPVFNAPSTRRNDDRIDLNGASRDETEDIEAISHLPLGIVNCEKSLRVERMVAQLSQACLPFTIKAPFRCTSCNSPRLQETRKVQEGVILCLAGPCRMHVEIFDCSKGPRCGRIHSEGRDHAIVLLSLSTAATHAMLRKVTCSVVLSNGTLKRNLQQYHSEMIANIVADLIPGVWLGSETEVTARARFQMQAERNARDGLISTAEIENVWASRSLEAPPSSNIGDEDTGPLGVERKWRSIRMIHKLCVVMCKLMVTSPPKMLFRCGTCEGENGRLHAVCADGIWSGYQRRLRKKFVNVSEPCRPLGISTAVSFKALKRPLTGLLRRERTAWFLILAIEGGTASVKEHTLSSAVSAVRLINSLILPKYYCHESISGRNAKDFEEDLHGVVPRLRKLTITLFNEKVLLERLCMMILKYVNTTATNTRKGRKRSKRLRSGDAQISTQAVTGSTDEDARRAIVRFFNANGTRVGDSEGDTNTRKGVCWNRGGVLSGKEGLSTFLPDLLMLYKALILAPATQLITKRQLGSLYDIATTCEKGNQEVVTALGRTTLPSEEEQSEGEQVLKFLRLLRGGLLAAAEFEEVCPGLLACLGGTLRDIADRVKDFYDFYNSLDLKACPAATFCHKWKGLNEENLRSLYLQIALARKVEGNPDNHYSTACRTGVFFPSHPQLRPMPFNDELKSVPQGDNFGICSKSYLQKNKTFTPGALTFCCSCSSPIILGFKVLEKNEGPRSVLDVLVSRFGTLPRHVIYDFGCGLYSSACHTLWWALEDTTVTSDSLHALNHKCSPSFYPTAHENLNMSNTVAHEQRNRAISEIEKSLRYTGQDFYIALLAYQVCVLNLKAKAKVAPRFERRPLGVSENDLEWAYFSCLELNCPCC